MVGLMVTQNLCTKGSGESDSELVLVFPFLCPWCCMGNSIGRAAGSRRMMEEGRVGGELLGDS